MKNKTQTIRNIVGFLNCVLLNREANGAGGKWFTLPDECFAGKDAAYLAKHLIPTDLALWKLDRFEDFITARKPLIHEKFKSVLVPTSGAKSG